MDQRNDGHEDKNCDVGVLDDAQEAVPLAAEEIAHAGDDRDPGDGPEKVEENKTPPI